MKTVDSDALGVISKALGLTGAGSPITEFLDGQLDQVLDVGPVVRRGRTQAGSEGIYNGIMRTVHAGAGELNVTLRPYEVATGGIAPYPVPMPAQFDVWLLNASLRRVSGTGTVTADLAIRYAASQQGWGVDDSGNAIVISEEKVVAYWDTIIATMGVEFVNSINGGPLVRIGLRLPRHVDNRFVLRVNASALATYDCQITTGVFPIALGQDGIL